jgi:hypothetical protein
MLYIDQVRKDEVDGTLTCMGKVKNTNKNFSRKT